MPSTKTITTGHGDIAVAESGGTGLPLVLIHGNSSCKEVFAQQLASPLADSNRLIAFDLPGHGASSNAIDPARTYSLAGLGDLTVELLGLLGVERAAVFGWSLGGHIAIELLPRYAGLAGLMITATPPVHPTLESLIGGYRAHPMVPLIGQEVLSADELAMFADTVYGSGVNDALRAAGARADGRARRIVIETALAGGSSDQRALAEHSRVPLAIVNGADDPIINIDYIESLTYDNLWEGRCITLAGEGHAPFLTNPAAFNAILERFLRDMAQEGPTRSAVKSSSTAAA